MKAKSPQMTQISPISPILTKPERRELLRLLGLLQTYLESSIESSLIPGTSEGMPEDRKHIAKDRRDWKTAEKWVSWLS